VILVDANILLYAENELDPRHEAAREWWDTQLSGLAPVCLCWPVISAFIRIGTNPRIFEHPLSLEQAIKRTQGWLKQPCVRVITPTDRHWELFQKCLTGSQAVANLVSDAHLAALAMEYGCVLMSTDGDFARFPKLKWANPLKC
jgi:toxin-antitoxin system PIN domain toxin